ncbi:RnfH family protein [Pusillimonas sp. ANT_WB101]|uniref:RnfH family protein n=1 Tax=Pusillimonas sp. ANT_WB101 TaxID=2597356 RepID=UPI0021043BD3|nr:RnfH family protein [Pusillimonas sp. ANT_WB101]
MNKRISVTVVYASAPADAYTAVTAAGIWQKSLSLAFGTTVGQAISESGFFDCHPQYSRQALVVGIYGKACAPERQLLDGDRIEIYRPLNFDPMESRRRRAQHKQNRLSQT